MYLNIYADNRMTRRPFGYGLFFKLFVERRINCYGYYRRDLPFSLQWEPYHSGAYSV